jgi:hypothetical protein
LFSAWRQVCRIQRCAGEGLASARYLLLLLLLEDLAAALQLLLLLLLLGLGLAVSSVVQ